MCKGDLIVFLCACWITGEEPTQSLIKNLFTFVRTTCCSWTAFSSFFTCRSAHTQSHSLPRSDQETQSLFTYFTGNKQTNCNELDKFLKETKSHDQMSWLLNSIFLYFVQDGSSTRFFCDVLLCREDSCALPPSEAVREEHNGEIKQN